jgi:serine phosphatase RsbU (regulator of sigma subunit)
VLEVACAGHPPPVVLRAGGVVEEVPARGRLLGVGPGARYEAVRVAVGPGDVAVLFTDGLTEAARARTGEGWKAAAAAAREQGAEAVAGALEAWARERSGGELGDDLALLVLAF